MIHKDNTVQYINYLDKIMPGLLAQQGKRAARISKSMAPVAPAKYAHSGQLRANVLSNVESDNKQWGLYLFVQESAIGMTGYYGRTPTLLKGRVHYAIYNEFGTYKMAARPFLTPAIEDVYPYLEQSIKAHLGTRQI